jgi:hypothetical protein
MGFEMIYFPKYQRGCKVNVVSRTMAVRNFEVNQFVGMGDPMGAVEFVKQIEKMYLRGAGSSCESLCAGLGVVYEKHFWARSGGGLERRRLGAAEAWSGGGTAVAP